MTKVLVLYYSSYGHLETMADAVAEGARSAGAEVAVKRVPELVPDEVAKASHFKLDQKAPVATVAELEDYDAIIVGSPTRFGRVAAQMANFWDQTGGVWFQGKLANKAVSAMTSAQNPHGGQEATILGLYTTFMHWGAVIVTPGYTEQAFFDAGGNPYGTSVTQGKFDEAKQKAVAAQAQRLVRFATKLMG